MTLANPCTFYLLTVLRARTTRRDSRQDQNCHLLTILKSPSTKTRLWRISKSLKCRWNKATWYWWHLQIHAIFTYRPLFTCENHGRPDSRQDHNWHLVTIVNFLSTKTRLWRIFKSLKIRWNKATWYRWHFQIHALFTYRFFTRESHARGSDGEPKLERSKNFSHVVPKHHCDAFLRV